MTEQVDKAAGSVVQMVEEWLSLGLSDERKDVLVRLVAMRLERFWPEIRESCGCVFCDIDLEPFEAEGAFWHSADGRDPVRCPITPTTRTERI